MVLQSHFTSVHDTWEFWKKWNKDDGQLALDARYLGPLLPCAGPPRAELRKRVNEMREGWCTMGKFWFSDVNKAMKKNIFRSRVQMKGLTGLQCFVLLKSHLKHIDIVAVKLLRSMMGGSVDYEGVHPLKLTNQQVLDFWGILPAFEELQALRLKWYQSMVEHTTEHGQMIAALFGRCKFENVNTISEQGFLTGTANPHAIQFGNDIKKCLSIQTGAT
jgi:hypothetical protein